MVPLNFVQTNYLHLLKIIKVLKSQIWGIAINQKTTKQLTKNIKELKTENLFNPRVAIILILNTSVPRNCINEGTIK